MERKRGEVYGAVKKKCNRIERKRWEVYIAVKEKCKGIERERWDKRAVENCVSKVHYMKSDGELK
jgi:hypothetical protein